MKWMYKTFLGSPLKLWASVGHWLLWHFDLNKYSEQQRPRVVISLAAVFAFMAIGWPLIIYYTGWAGLVKYWLMPWLGYHFWMSECWTDLLVPIGFVLCFFLFATTEIYRSISDAWKTWIYTLAPYLCLGDTFMLLLFLFFTDDILSTMPRYRYIHCDPSHGSAYSFQARWGMECSESSAVWYRSLRFSCLVSIVHDALLDDDDSTAHEICESICAEDQ